MIRNLLTFAVMATVALTVAAQAKAGVTQLGSFKNTSNGQDKPIEAVIAAIEVATGSTPMGLEFFYKSSPTDGETGIAAGNFATTFNGPKNVGYVTQGTTIDFGSGEYGVATYLTAKIDGPNGGFILYEWDGFSAKNYFDNEFWEFGVVDNIINGTDGKKENGRPDGLDDNTGLTYKQYAHDNGTYNEINPWAEQAEAGTVIAGQDQGGYGVSHVSVWGVRTNVPPPPPVVDPVPEPASLAVWAFGALVLSGGVARRRRKQAS